MLLLLLPRLGNGANRGDGSWCGGPETGPVKRRRRRRLLRLRRLRRHSGLGLLQSWRDDSGRKYARRKNTGLRLRAWLGWDAGLLLHTRLRRRSGLNFAGWHSSRLRDTGLWSARNSARLRSGLRSFQRRRSHARKLFPEKDGARCELLGGGCAQDVRADMNPELRLDFLFPERREQMAEQRDAG